MQRPDLCHASLTKLLCVVDRGPIARKLDKGDLVPDAELAGTIPLWEWIGDEGATTFNY